MDNTETINVLSLCTGYGGLELGLSRALENPMRVVAVEVNAYALANLAAKAQEGKLAIEAMWSDLKTFPAERFRGCFDFIVAGYPCQPFSCAGKRQGESDPRHLWPHIERIIKTIRPVWFFGENVAGHLTLGFPEVYRSLRNMGYAVEAGLFSAAECGAPHRRARLFILAYQQNERLERFTKNRSEQGEFDRSSQLADNSNSRCTTGKIQQKRESTSKLHCWPARSGQSQYEWEEPRTVDDTRSEKRTRLSDNEREEISEIRETSKELGDPHSDIQRRQSCNIRKTASESIANAKQSREIRNNIRGTSEQGQAQSRLGGAVNGASSRVDRLRLLGNGVVPQQAEKAFRYLVDRFKNFGSIMKSA